jgi:hypothetical protein
MKLGRLLQIALIAAAVLIMAASASASTITWNTNTGSQFASGGTIIGGGLILESVGGTSSELTFTPNVSSTNVLPTNVDFGDFLITCGTGCTSATYNAFTFDLVIDDTTDGAFGTFVGTSAGGTVTPTSSTISILWSPLTLGPGTNGASSGSFLNTIFNVPNLTLVVAPNSGSPAGDTSIQGVVTGVGITPEPATMAMAGSLLLGLAALARKRRA